MADEFVALVQASIPHPLILVRFRLDTDLGMVFYATENESGELNGIGLAPVRLSKGANFIRLNPDLIHRVFCPTVKKVSDSGSAGSAGPSGPAEWLLSIRPLQHPTRIQKRKNGKYVCFYPFPEQGRSGQVVDVWVDGTPPPALKMWFTINATYQASKDSAKQNLQAIVQCPPDFTRELVALSEGRS